MRELIHAYKFEDRPGIARLFSNMTFEMMNTFLPTTNVVVPVPTSLQAFVKRGYDTNFLGILRFLSRKVEIRIENTSQYRERLYQSTLKMKDRIDNVKDKFRLKKKPSCDSVILFDDVVTSGATASQCARVLREGGVKDIVFCSCQCKNRPHGSWLGEEDSNSIGGSRVRCPTNWTISQDSKDYKAEGNWCQDV